MQFVAIGGSVTLDLSGGRTAAFTELAFVRIGGDLKVHMDTGGVVSLESYTTVGGSVNVSLNDSPNGFDSFSLGDSTIGGSLTVSSRSGANVVLYGDDYAPAGIGGGVNVRLGGDGGSMWIGGTITVGGDVNANLGGANKSLTIDGTSGAQIAGTVRYQGGTGPDAIAISGQNTFRLIVHTGGGDDTVAFDSDARVGSALIDFGEAPGNKSWVPPAVIDFPLVLRNYP